MSARILVSIRFLCFAVVMALLLSLVFQASEATSAQTPEIVTLRIDTDSSWKSLDVHMLGWTKADFDDSWWQSAQQLFQLDNFGRAFAIWHPGSPKPTSAYFRKDFLIEGVEVISGRIYLRVYSYNAAVEHNAYVYVNDDYLGVVGGHWNWRYGLGYSTELYITDHLKPGSNTIAIRVEAAQPGTRKYYWGLTGQVQYAKKPLVSHQPVDPTSEPLPDAWQPYVDLYGQVTDVYVGEEVIAYLSTANPITSPGTLRVQLTLRIPSGWSVSGSGFAAGVGGLWATTHIVEQGANPQAINVKILANEPFEGDLAGYIDYYFEGEATRYRDHVTLPVRAKSEASSSSETNTPKLAESTTGQSHPGSTLIIATLCIALFVLLIAVFRRKCNA